MIEVQLAKQAASPVTKAIKSTPDIALRYKGFAHEWEKDSFDPMSSHGYDSITGTDYYSDYDYLVDADTIFDKLIQDIIPAHINSVPNTPLLDEYKKLDKAYETTTPETEDDTWEALSLFVAENLEGFVDIFYDELLNTYQEEAEQWALENEEPNDPRYDW
jgi:dsDNA-binding SOS-regulon protein